MHLKQKKVYYSSVNFLRQCNGSEDKDSSKQADTCGIVSHPEQWRMTHQDVPTI